MARAFDNGHTYADSKADAVSRATRVLEDVAQACPGAKFTLTGYSQAPMRRVISPRISATVGDRSMRIVCLLSACWPIREPEHQGPRQWDRGRPDMASLIHGLEEWGGLCQVGWHRSVTPAICTARSTKGRTR